MPRLLIAALVSVMASVTAFGLTIDAPIGIAYAVVPAGMLPLLLAFPGVRSASIYTYQWLSIVTVFYVGLGLAETIASLGKSLGGVALALTSSILMVALLRAIKRDRQASRESTGS